MSGCFGSSFEDRYFEQQMLDHVDPTCWVCNISFEKCSCCNECGETEKECRCFNEEGL